MSSDEEAAWVGLEAALVLTPLGNGLDFIHSALDHLVDEEEPSAHKYAVLHLSAGIELVLKARLIREHWALVFQNPGKASRAAFEEGRFQSVRLDDCIGRLDEVCGVHISDHRKELTRFKDLRNSIEHFGVTTTLIALRSSAASALAVVLEVLGREFDVENLESDEAASIDRLRERLVEFNTFAEQRLAAIAPTLRELRDRGAAVLTCPACGQVALQVGKDNGRCHFCGLAGAGIELIDEYMWRVHTLDQYTAMKDGGDWPVATCPLCGTPDAFLYLPFSDEPSACFACGLAPAAATLDTCLRCGDVFMPSDGESACGTCFAIAMERN